MFQLPPIAKASVFILLLEGLLLYPSTCTATVPYETIVVVEMSNCCGERAYPEAERALRDELQLLHIPVVSVSGKAVDETAQREELEQIARLYQAAAAVRLTRAEVNERAEVRLWITDLVTRKTVYRRIEIDESNELSLPMLVAMRTVETLRASLLELQDKTARDDRPVSDEIRHMVDRNPPSPTYLFGVGVSSGLTMSPGGAGIRAAFGAAAFLQPVQGLDISTSVNWSPLGGTYSEAGVRSTLTYIQFRGWIHYRLISHSLLRPAIGLGAGAFLGKAIGETESDATVTTARTYVPYVGASARVYVFASEHVPFYIDGTAGLLIPEAKVVHGGTQAASLGKPLIELRFGLEIRFGQK
ncbi:MAG: hypothetical protein JXX29_01535 [Deltaproteobacteria bacterium]|nr:hypothetical protein [Deltaproteobacteria bacterium]MBN2670321.1 hypothetical protein [Deltaproteobacteria bacterium]